MEYLNDKFSVAVGSKKYTDNWDRIFGKKSCKNSCEEKCEEDCPKEKDRRP